MNVKIRNSRKEGVALILVVGMLALMMVLGVAFAIFMRTERVASGFYKNDVKTRLLLHVALNRALEVANSNSTTRMYPQWDALVSTGTNYVETPMNSRLLSHFPYGALVADNSCIDSVAPFYRFVLASNAASLASAGFVLNMNDLSYGLITNVSGQELFHVALTNGLANAWSVGDKCRILQPAWMDIAGGRVGFVVINCSGLLDANYAGGAGVRGVGGSGEEIRLGHLPEGVDENRLLVDRVTLYETLQELTCNGTNNDPIVSVFDRRPGTFVCYSAIPEKYYFPGTETNMKPVYIGGPASNLVNETKKMEILEAFKRSYAGDPAYSGLFTSFSDPEPEILYANLVDFVDDDVTPGNFGDTNAPGMPEGPYVEPIWMVNEICVSNVMTFDFDYVSSNYDITASCNVGAEYVFPFIGRTLDQKKRFVPYVEMSAISGPSLTTFSGATNFIPYIKNVGINPLSPEYQMKFSTCAMSSNGYEIGLGEIPIAPLENTFRVKVVISNAASGFIVDVANNIPDIPVTMTVTPNGVDLGGTVTQFLGSGIAYVECRDPRLNYESGQWEASAAGSWGSINSNTLTISWGEGRAVPKIIQLARDHDFNMYVKNSGLTTVGELGYLFYGKEWETVRLVPNGSAAQGKIHPVLDYFTVSQSSNGAYKGKVNLNTQNRDVMTAIVKDMPTATPSSVPLDDTAVAGLTDYMIERSYLSDFTALSELGTVPFTNYWSAAITNWMDREAFARNMVGLVGIQQRYYLILLYAEANKLAPDGKISVSASAKGVAEVWQDPVPVQVGGGYRTMVRMIQLLDEQ